MSVYSVTGKGWRYDFTHKGIRYAKAWFKTKKEAQRAEAQKREELRNPPVVEENRTDTDFFELVNVRLDHIKAYNSKHHYVDHIYRAKRWVKVWGKLKCSEITAEMVEKYILNRNRISANVANREIRALRAMFNYGKKRKLVEINPVDEIEFLPVEKRLKYIPSVEDIDKVVKAAPHDVQDYLICICDTMARMSEVNQLTWQDINFEKKYIVLYTRKKKGGHLTPRKIPMTNRLVGILKRRYASRDERIPWVFWHRYFNRSSGMWEEGPFKDRKRIMRTLCEQAGVKYFRFHALRHAGASIMDNNNVPIGAIQSILGHENRTTTEIYLHNLGGIEKEAISVYESVRELSHTNSHT